MLNKLGVAALSAIALCASFSVQAGAFEDKADRFSGSRTVHWNSIPSKEEDFALSTLAIYAKGQKTPAYYGVTLITYSHSWQFISCNFNDWLVDGKPFPALSGTYENSMAGSATIERFTAKMSRKDLETVAAAKLVEFKVCNTEGKVSSEDLSGIRKVLEATK